MDYRKERDLLGEKEVPADAYWGIHTERARENFRLSRYRVMPELMLAYAMVKKACCAANAELGCIEPKKAQAIRDACDRLIEGGFADQFPVDALQGGAGTSTNMNVNEVIANIAIESLGGKKGDYHIVAPIADVNLHQSTNDTYPTALRIAAIRGFRTLADRIAALQGAFQKKEKEFAGIVKNGRTEMQDAVPMTLGAQFGGFAEALARDRWRTFKCEERLRVVNIGGTAVGTGLCAPRSYIFLVIEKLREITGLGLSRGENLVDQTANADSFVEVSGILKAHAANLMKIANDLRLMNLLDEIELPRLQAGSSIMPGKVNPVALEAVVQAAMKVTANDALITSAAAAGTQQIVEFMPLLSFSLLEALELLANVNELLTVHVAQVRANAVACRQYLDRSTALVTAFVPAIGYEKASTVIKGYDPASGKTVRDFLIEKMGKELVEKTLSPEKLTALGYEKDA